MDLVHILAFQAFKFWKSLRQSNNTTLYNTFMCFSREDDYMVLLRTYSGTITDSIGILKCKVLEHYSSVCAAREVIDCFFFFFVYLCTVCRLFIYYYYFFGAHQHKAAGLKLKLSKIKIVAMASHSVTIVVTFRSHSIVKPIRHVIFPSSVLF